MTTSTKLAALAVMLAVQTAMGVAFHESQFGFNALNLCPAPDDEAWLYQQGRECDNNIMEVLEACSDGPFRTGRRKSLTMNAGGG